MVQRRAARWTLNRHHNTSSVKGMLEDLQWRTLEQRRTDCRLVLLFQIIHGLVQIPPASYLQPSLNGYRTLRPGSVSARKNMDVSAKGMDDSAKNDERFGQKIWTFRPNNFYIFNSFSETNDTHYRKQSFRYFACRLLRWQCQQAELQKTGINFAEKSRQQ